MIEIIIIASLICTTIHVMTFEGMIGFFVRVGGDMYLPKMIRKPLYECLPCMASIWGTLAVVFLMEDYGIYLHKAVASVLAVCGLNAIIASVLNLPNNDGQDPDSFDESAWGL